jgi:hypothetical protein
MKKLILAGLGCCLMACSGAPDSGAEDTSGAAAVTASSSYKFTCSSDDDSWTLTNLTVSPKGDQAATVVAKFDQDDKNYEGTQNLKYKPRTGGNTNFIKLAWTKDDPWQDTGESWLLVHKDLLAGKAGTVKFQISGEGFINYVGTCKPN